MTIQAIPKKHKTEAITFKLTDEELARVKSYADRENRTISDLIRLIVFGKQDAVPSAKELGNVEQYMGVI